MSDFFPSKYYTIEITNDPKKALDRLKENTLNRARLVSERTDKRFIGKVDDTEYRVISSVIGKGAFCVLQGHIDPNTGSGTLSIEIHKAFKVLVSIWSFLPIGAAIYCLVNGRFADAFLPLVFLLFVWLIGIKLLFNFLYPRSLEELVEVLDISDYQEE
jgi:hypothetical protein